MIKVNETKVTFKDDVRFMSHHELEKLYKEQGTENLDEIAENLDAVGYTSVHMTEPVDQDGVLFFF